MLVDLQRVKKVSCRGGVGIVWQSVRAEDNLCDVLSVWSVHSQIEVAAADACVPDKWRLFKATAALCVSNITPYYLIKGWREKTTASILYNCHSKEHASTCGYKDSVITFC